jgi:hypothetical protein
MAPSYTCPARVNHGKTVYRVSTRIRSTISCGCSGITAKVGLEAVEVFPTHA